MGAPTQPETSQAVTADVVSLDEPRAADPRITGRKACTLARLRQAGYAVPAGHVVTTAACAALTVPAQRAPAEPAGELQGRLAAVLEALGGGPVAVRSSGVAEDLGGASYAGQYETVLGVDSADGLCEAVARCVASAASERVAAYAGSDGSQPPAMAVLIQRQVPAEAAGVAFSANPVTGDRDETLVSAVSGPGDRLVAGTADPDEWVVRDGQPECLAAPEGALTDQQVERIAELAARLEAELGEPQDVEWAIADGDLALLQSRPITALPQRPDLDVPSEGTWMKDVAHYPELVTPLGASVFLPALDAGINRMFADYGMLLERIENRCIGGEIYGRVTPVGGQDGPPPPWWVLGILARILPALRARTRTARQVFEEGRLEAVSRRWEERWRDELRTAAEELRSAPLGELSDEALQAHLEEAIGLLERGQLIHFRLFAPYVVGVHELAMACEELLGWEPIEAMDLLTGLSEASSEPARRLAALAARIREHPEVDLLSDPPENLIARLEESAGELAAEFHDYVERYGHRAINYDPGAPTLAEQPQLVASLLRDAAEREHEDVPAALAERRRAAERRARQALAEQADEAGRARFEAALERARAVYPQREDNIFWTDNLPSGLIRRAALEAGRRLAGRGQLARPDDVAYVEIDELRPALADPSRELAGTARRRRREQAWVAAHPGPPFHGEEPADFPDVRGLPEPARRVNAAFLWFMGHEYRASARETDEGLGGAPGSPGRYTGPVRVIEGEADFDRLRPGDVLVAPVTTPVWSVLFGQAGAVVTDGGGTLSHAAIVAREHGIPAVLATGDATSVLEDGQTVTVDGAAGRVVPAPPGRSPTEGPGRAAATSG